MIFDDFYEDKTGKFEAFMPFVPHTVSKQAKSCETCHKNILKKDDLLNLFDGKTLKSTPLSKEQELKLKSEKYKKIRAKMLFESK